MKKILLAILSGLLLAFGWPTYGLPLFLFFGFVPLLLVEDSIRHSHIKRKKLTLFYLSYISFFIWNVITTNWIRYADEFGACFAILVNSLLMTLIVLIYHNIAKRTSRNKGLLFLITLWICFEKMHLGWEFSWPWLNLGNGFSENITWIQWYEYTGSFGGTLWVWVINALAFKGVLEFQKRGSKRKFKRFLIKLCVLIAIPILISKYLYKTYKDHGTPVNVILLQPNIDPYSEKYNTPNAQIADLLLQLSNKKTTDSTDFIIAPETVFAKHLKLNQIGSSFTKYKLDNYIKQYSNVNILTGVSLIDLFDDASQIKRQSNKLRENLWYDDYNSAIMLNSNDSIQLYHKSKLVVGIENLPYAKVLRPLLGNFMIDMGGTIAMKTTQNHRGVFTSANNRYKVGPIICYESVYGEFVTEYIRNGANFLAIITNDAWWNNTQGHKQHLSYARLRAIETRRAIARSANTGISAIINAKGEITKSLAYNSQGALEGTLHTNSKQTFYVKSGDYIFRISAFVMVFLFLTIRFRKD